MSSKPGAGQSLLALGNSRELDLAFVTGEQKADWFVRADGVAVYPRHELVDEYRRASNGKSLRLMSLHELLEELKVANDVVQDVKQAEVQANTAILLDQASSATIGSFPGSLIFVNIRQQSFWGPAKGGEEEGTQLRGIWSVTNVSDRDHYILDARLDEHRTNYVVFSIEDPTTGLHSAKHVIRPKSTTELAANFFFFPPIISESVPLVADVVFTDNFGRQHLVRSEFHPVGRPS